MFHKIEIRGKEILWNEQAQGRILTHPPQGTREQIGIACENDITFFRIRWKVANPPQPAVPLELVKIELPHFVSNSMFVAGRRYEFSGSPRPEQQEKGFPYNTYYKFRIPEKPPYDAALHAKMPLACWQMDGRAFAVAFPKFVSLSIGRWPLLIHPSGEGAPASFSAILPDQFEVDKKPHGWFGARSTRERRKIDLSKGEPIEALFALIAADSWPECVRKYADWLYRAEQVEPLSTASLTDLLERCLHFYDRVWDGRNHTHVHLPIKNVPRFESVEFKHSHITDDITKLALYRRLIASGWEAVVPRESKLVHQIINDGYSYKESGSVLWHTTTYLNGRHLDAFTHHGVGFVGFPGGMATNVRRLFEYHSYAVNDAIGASAESGADWLLKHQRKDGSWPALHQKDQQENAQSCIASTAESARALLAAYRQTKKRQYLDAAGAAAAYVNRDASFFECKQYLRDVSPSEPDGISAEACIHANLDMFQVNSEGPFLQYAEKWGDYALQWVRPFFMKEDKRLSFDGLSRSITPRVDTWGGLLIARAFMRLSRASGEQWWLRLAWRLFQETVRLQERDGGLSETWFFDFPDGFESIHIEPTFVTDALVEFLLDAAEAGAGKNALAQELLKRNKALEDECPPLKPAAPIQNLVAISKIEPEFIINRNLRLSPVFSGAESQNRKFSRFLFKRLRSKSGRPLLKMIPASKILLSRHRVRPPVAQLRPADPVKIKNMRSENFVGGRERCTYTGRYYTMIFSILGAGMNQQGRPANDIALDIEALAGDLLVDQVRIDLIGKYAIQSASNKKIVVSAGGIEYRIWLTGGSIDGVIQQENMLAFDISLSANWNFFGEHHLLMRIERGD